MPRPGSRPGRSGGSVTSGLLGGAMSPVDGREGLASLRFGGARRPPVLPPGRPAVSVAESAGRLGAWLAGPSGRGDVAGGGQGGSGVGALRRVGGAAGVAAEQAVVLGAGVGGAAGGLAAGAAVVCRAAGTGAGGLRPAGLGRVAGGRAAA